MSRVMDDPAPGNRLFRVVVPVVAIGLLGLAGCGSSGHVASGGAALDLDDFVAARSGAAPAVPVLLGAAGDPETTTPADPEVGPMPAGPGGVIDRVPPPRGDESVATPLEAGDRVVVDSLIGQVNGRPIFADEFFEPWDALLRNTAAGASDRADFTQKAARIVGGALEAEITDSLLDAEAQNVLSVEQQQGLRFFARELLDQTAAQRGRSRAEADREVRRTEGQSLEEFVESKQREMLQQNLFRERFRDRILVSKFDVEREYERRFDEFNPPPSTRIDRLVVFKSRPEVIELVSGRLEAGEDIATIADELAADGRGRRIEIGTFAVVPSGLDTMDDATEKLREVSADFESLGDWFGPDEGRSSVSWFFVGDVVREAGLPLSDPAVQRRLKSDITRRRQNAEFTQYRAELRTPAIVAEERRMLRTLMDITIERYWLR